ADRQSTLHSPQTRPEQVESQNMKWQFFLTFLFCLSIAAVQISASEQLDDDESDNYLVESDQADELSDLPAPENVEESNWDEQAAPQAKARIGK
ncbi:hypothetical protein BOX15_Mlig017210g1, partial [Macrostomum lignano]